MIVNNCSGFTTVTTINVTRRGGLCQSACQFIIKERKYLFGNIGQLSD